MKFVALVVASCVLVASAALAHPGHGATPSSSPLHFLTEVEHVAGLGLVVVVAAGVMMFRRRGSNRTNRS